MSNFGWLMGGLLAGAAGLATAALVTSKKSDDPLDSLDDAKPSETRANDATGLKRQLDRYFFKASTIIEKCTSLDMESGDLMATSIEMPDDSILQKMGDKIGDKLNVKLRQWKLQELVNLKKEAAALYLQYRDVFDKANALLEKHGLPQVSLKGLNFGGKDFSLNNSIDNEEWTFDFGDLADRVTNFLEKSQKASEDLVDGLEKILGHSAAGNHPTLAALPA